MRARVVRVGTQVVHHVVMLLIVGAPVVNGDAGDGSDHPEHCFCTSVGCEVLTVLVCFVSVFHEVPPMRKGSQDYCLDSPSYLTTGTTLPCDCSTVTVLVPIPAVVTRHWHFNVLVFRDDHQLGCAYIVVLCSAWVGFGLGCLLCVFLLCVFLLCVFHVFNLHPCFVWCKCLVWLE